MKIHFIRDDLGEVWILNEAEPRLKHVGDDTDDGGWAVSDVAEAFAILRNDRITLWDCLRALLFGARVGFIAASIAVGAFVLASTAGAL